MSKRILDLKKRKRRKKKKINRQKAGTKDYKQLKNRTKTKSSKRLYINIHPIKINEVGSRTENLFERINQIKHNMQKY